MLPESAKWEIWSGAEIEGDSELGKETLFIRKLETTAEHFKTIEADMVSRLTAHGERTRVWFCKEFQNWPLLREIAKHFKTVCVEATPKSYDNLPRDIKTQYTIYLKVNFLLKVGDFVCVGAPYQDEAFRIGTGQRVTPEQYNNDRKIK